MTFKHCLLPILVHFLLPALAAQTFIVDEQNGPGANFTSIAAAIAAVPEGAILQVRPGVYSNFRIDDQSITISCEPGVLVQGTLLRTPPIEIVNVSAGKHVSIRGVAFQFVLSTFPISCHNSAGTIVLEDVTMTGGGPIGTGKLLFTNCDHVAIRDSRLETVGLFDATIECFDSNVVVTDTQMLSNSFCLRQGGGRVVLSNCLLENDPGLFPTAVAFLAGGDLVLNDGTRLRTFAPGSPPAVEGQGTVTVDPSVTIGATVGPFGSAIAVDQSAVPAATAAPGVLGGNATAAVTLPAGAMGALFVGFPGAPTTYAGIAHAFWLAPGCSVEAIGSGNLTGGYAVPNAPFVLGVQVTWQGVAWTTGSHYAAASNPATYAHH